MLAWKAVGRALARAIASSSRAEYIGWALALFGLDHHFGGHVYSADGWDRGKPHPDIYLAAATGLGVDPARCLAVEDSPTGAKAALAALLPITEVTETTLISPAQAEKKLKKLKLGLPDDQVISVSSGNTMAPESDPRPAVLQIGSQLTAALSKLV